MEIFIRPAEVGLTIPLRPQDRKEEAAVPDLFVDLLSDIKAFRDELARRRELAEKGKAEGRWVPLAERVLESSRLPLAPPPGPEAFARLGRLFPNFREAGNFIRDQAALARAGGKALRFPPLLLAGPPGVGKTSFALELAKTLGIPARPVNLAQATSGFIFTGASLVWASGRPGAILDLLLREVGNPLMILDELDKAEAGADQSIPDVLLNLLEPRTAGSFTDEALDWPVDASNMLWIALVNDPRKVSEPILSRFSVIEVREPTRDEMNEAIIPEIYRDILDKYGLIGRFGEELDHDVCRGLSQNPRTARKRIIQALARAAETGKTRLDLSDLGEDGKTIVRRIGFGKKVGG